MELLFGYTIDIAFAGHTSTHIPHPLQYSRFMRMGIVLLMTASGQNSQHRKHAGFFCLAGMHLLWCITGIRLRHSPVFPASPIAGDDSSQICLHSLVPMHFYYQVISGLVISNVRVIAARLVCNASSENLCLITFSMLARSTI